jgi:hypothetical protein
MAAVILSLSHDRLLLPSAVAVTVAAPRTLPPHPPPSSTADRVLLRPFAATLVRRLRLLPGLLSHSRLAVMLLLHVCMTRLLQQLQQAAVGECCRPSAEPSLVAARRLRLLPGLLSHSRLAVMLLLHVCMTRLLQQLQQAAVGECCRPSAEPPLVVR